MTWAFEPANWAVNGRTVHFGGRLVEIPKAAADVLESFEGNGPLVVHIQDLHCNYEVQKNIARLIDTLAENQQLQMVGVEGASLPINPAQLRGFPVAEVRNEVGDYFLRQGKLSGAEYYAATGRHAIALEGVEDSGLYTQARQAVDELVRDESQGLCLDLREQLEALKPGIYAPALMKFDQARIAYQQGGMGLAHYVRYLLEAARTLGLPKDGYPALRAYAASGQALLAGDVEADRLFREIDLADRELRGRLYTSERQRRLDGWIQRLELIERLVNISASPEDVAQFRARPQDFKVAGFAAFVRENAPASEFDSQLFTLDTYVAAADRFYTMADQRSRALVENLLDRMARRRAPAAVLVTGGYHTGEILAQLRERGVSFIALKPRMTRADLANPYYALLRNRRTPLEKWLAQSQNFFALEPLLPKSEDPTARVPENRMSARERVFARSLELYLKTRALARHLAARGAQRRMQPGLEEYLGKADPYVSIRPETAAALDTGLVSFPVTLADGRQLQAFSWQAGKRPEIPKGSGLEEAEFAASGMAFTDPETGRAWTERWSRPSWSGLRRWGERFASWFGQERQWPRLAWQSPVLFAELAGLGIRIPIGLRPPVMLIVPSGSGSLRLVKERPEIQTGQPDGQDESDYTIATDAEKAELTAQLREAARAGHETYESRFFAALPEMRFQPRADRPMRVFEEPFLKYATVLKETRNGTATYWLAKKPETYIPLVEPFNSPQRERLGYLLSHEFSNSAEIRRVKGTKAERLPVFQRTADEAYLTRLVVPGNFEARQIPDQTRSAAFAGMLVAVTFLRKFDHYQDNWGYLNGLPVAIDHDQIMHGLETKNRELATTRFLHSLLEALMDTLTRDRYYDEAIRLDLRKIRQGDPGQALQNMQEVFHKYRIGEAIIAAQELNPEDIRASIQRFKQLDNIGGLVAEAGYTGKQAGQITAFYQANQDHLGKDMDGLWRVLTGHDAGFASLDKPGSGNLGNTRAGGWFAQRIRKLAGLFHIQTAARKGQAARALRAVAMAGLLVEIPLLLWLAAPGAVGVWLPFLGAQAPVWLQTLGFPGFLLTFAAAHAALLALELRLRGQQAAGLGLAFLRQAAVFAGYLLVYGSAVLQLPAGLLLGSMGLAAGQHLVYDWNALTAKLKAPNSIFYRLVSLGMSMLPFGEDLEAIEDEILNRYEEAFQGRAPPLDADTLRAFAQGVRRGSLSIGHLANKFRFDALTKQPDFRYTPASARYFSHMGNIYTGLASDPDCRKRTDVFLRSALRQARRARPGDTFRVVDIGSGPLPDTSLQTLRTLQADDPNVEVRGVDLVQPHCIVKDNQTSIQAAFDAQGNLLSMMGHVYMTSSHLMKDPALLGRLQANREELLRQARYAFAPGYSHPQLGVVNPWSQPQYQVKGFVTQEANALTLKLPQPVDVIRNVNITYSFLPEDQARFLETANANLREGGFYLDVWAYRGYISLYRVYQKRNGRLQALSLEEARSLGFTEPGKPASSLPETTVAFLDELAPRLLKVVRELLDFYGQDLEIALIGKLGNPDLRLLQPGYPVELAITESRDVPEALRRRWERELGIRVTRLSKDALSRRPNIDLVGPAYFSMNAVSLVHMLMFQLYQPLVDSGRSTDVFIEPEPELEAAGVGEDEAAASGRSFLGMRLWSLNLMPLLFTPQLDLKPVLRLPQLGWVLFGLALAAGAYLAWRPAVPSQGKGTISGRVNRWLARDAAELRAGSNAAWEFQPLSRSGFTRWERWQRGAWLGDFTVSRDRRCVYIPDALYSRIVQGQASRIDRALFELAVWWNASRGRAAAADMLRLPSTGKRPWVHPDVQAWSGRLEGIATEDWITPEFRATLEQASQEATGRGLVEWTVASRKELRQRMAQAWKAGLPKNQLILVRMTVAEDSSVASQTVALSLEALRRSLRPWQWERSILNAPFVLALAVDRDASGQPLIDLDFIEIGRDLQQRHPKLSAALHANLKYRLQNLFPQARVRVVSAHPATLASVGRVFEAGIDWEQLHRQKWTSDWAVAFEMLGITGREELDPKHVWVSELRAALRAAKQADGLAGVDDTAYLARRLDSVCKRMVEDPAFYSQTVARYPWLRELWDQRTDARAYRNAVYKKMFIGAPLEARLSDRNAPNSLAYRIARLALQWLRPGQPVTPRLRSWVNAAGLIGMVVEAGLLAGLAGAWLPAGFLIGNLGWASLASMPALLIGLAAAHPLLWAVETRLAGQTLSGRALVRMGMKQWAVFAPYLGLFALACSSAPWPLLAAAGAAAVAAHALYDAREILGPGNALAGRLLAWALLPGRLLPENGRRAWHRLWMQWAPAAYWAQALEGNPGMARIVNANPALQDAALAWCQQPVGARRELLLERLWQACRQPRNGRPAADAALAFNRLLAAVPGLARVVRGETLENAPLYLPDLALARQGRYRDWLQNLGLATRRAPGAQPVRPRRSLGQAA